MGFFNQVKKQKEEKILQQDLKQEAGDSSIFMIHYLFEQEPKMPDMKEVEKAVREKFGDIDVVSKDKDLASFAIKKYLAKFSDLSLPPQILLIKGKEFEYEKIDELYKSQLWNVQNGTEVLEKCKYQVMISDMMASVLDYKERCDLLMDWMEVAISLFPSCKAVWIPSAGKLFTADMVRHHQISRNDRFVYFCVNARFFNVQDSEDMVVDTLGMHMIGLPDIQYHFHGLEPNSVVNHAYNVASYVFDNNAPIKSGQTIDGLENEQININIQWKCQYEDALIQPARGVMDVCTGEFASGNRI